MSVERSGKQENYGQYSPSNSKTYLSNCFEHIYHLTFEKQEIDKQKIGVPYQDKNNTKRFGEGKDLRDRGNVWFVPYDNKKYHKTKHPCTFPQKLCDLMLGMCKNSGLVVDPFCGVGTVGLACKKINRPFIGIDLSASYLEEAKINLGIEN